MILLGDKNKECTATTVNPPLGEDVLKVINKEKSNIHR